MSHPLGSAVKRLATGLLVSAAATSAAIGLASPTAPPPGAPGQSSLPAQLQWYLDGVVRPTADERQQLLAGAPLAKLLPADESKEVATFGAVFIGGPMRHYVETAKDIEVFERGGPFLITKRIADPPALADFAALQLPEDDVKDLRNCRVGACAIKLGEDALKRLRAAVDWSSPTARADVENIVRQLAFEYVTGYREGGNERLAVYRDRSRPTFVATEFRTMIEAMPALTSYLPQIRDYLLNYPRVTLEGATSFLYWQTLEFGLKPTLRVTHMTIQERPAETIIVSKLLYASHYFWTGLELRVLIPDASGRGFWFVTVTRSRADGLGGLTGAVARRKVHDEARDGVISVLKFTKNWLEGRRP